MSIAAPALLYVLDQGRETQQKINIGPSTVVVLSGEEFPVNFGSGPSSRQLVIDRMHLAFLITHILALVGHVPPVLVDPVSEEMVRGAESLITDDRGQDRFALSVISPTGHVDPTKPTRIVQEVRRAVARNSTVSGTHSVSTAGAFLQAVSKTHDVGLGVWPDLVTTSAYFTFRNVEIVPDFHSSLRRIMQGGAKQATDKLLPRKIDLD